MRHAAPSQPLPANAPRSSRTDSETLRRLLPYLWTYKWRVAVALGFMVAAKLATVLQAEKLLMLTNIRGVLDKEGQLLTELTPRRIDELCADGTISCGMIPKIAGALDAAKSGVHAVHIIDGRVPHAMLLEFFTARGAGTLVAKGR